MRTLSLLLLTLFIASPGFAAGDVTDVMSFNIRYGTAGDGVNDWPNRRDLVVAVIRDAAPDLLGTQEVLAEQAVYLRGALPAYGFHGVGRDDGQAAGEMTAIFYLESRFERLDGGHFWLSETPDIPGSRSWGSACTRMVSWLRLKVRNDGSEIHLFNTHFDHVSREAREEAAKLLQRRIVEIAGDARVIVTGDFNAPGRDHEDATWRIMLGETKRGRPLTDGYALLHPNEPSRGTFHGFSGDDPGERIDWILLGGDLTPLAAEIITTRRNGRYPSDHFPVTTRISRGGAR